MKVCGVVISVLECVAVVMRPKCSCGLNVVKRFHLSQFVIDSNVKINGDCHYTVVNVKYTLYSDICTMYTIQ